MRVLLIGPVHREKAFLNQKSNKQFLVGQGQQSWVEALSALGHKVFTFRYTDSVIFPNKLRIILFEEILSKDSKLYGKALRVHSKFYLLSPENFLKNRKLLMLADKVKPDLVLISGGAAFLFPKTVRTIKTKLDSKIVLFSGIDPSESSVKSEKDLFKEGLIDLVCVNDRGAIHKWKRIGAKDVVVLPVSSFDPKIHKKMMLDKDLNSDVAFVGTLSRKRQLMLLELTKFNLKIWGDIPARDPLDERLRPYYFGKAFGEKIARIFSSSKIIINYQPEDMEYGGNMRTFEIPASGVLQLVDKVDSNFFKIGEEIVTFSDSKDLKKKIAYYLKNDKERKKIAEAGYRRVRKDHSYERHLEKLLSKI